MFGAEADAARESYRFGAKAAGETSSTLAKQYNQQIFREYALTDLSHYLVGRVGFRWRTKAEVVSGKGIDKCAEVACTRVVGLHTFETPFTFEEDGHRQTSLVKVRLCGPCGAKLLHQRAMAGKSSEPSGAGNSQALDARPAEQGASSAENRKVLSSDRRKRRRSRRGDCGRSSSSSRSRSTSTRSRVEGTRAHYQASSGEGSVAYDAPRAPSAGAVTDR